MEVALRRGFVWPSFEIYGSAKGFYDYGPMGSLLKKNIEELIRKSYVVEEGCVEVSCPTVTPEDVWVASGHVSSFSDFTTECTKCGEPYRADHLIEEHVDVKCDGMTSGDLEKLIEKNKIVCPKCKGKLSSIYDYNLMFKTYIGPGKSKVTAYLRPETAQTTYLPFKRLYNICREKMPLGVMQIGRSFRNEISPRQGMIRLREFTQAEIQYFTDPENKDNGKFKEVEDIKVRMLSKESQEKNEVLEMTLGKAVEKGIIKLPMIAYFLGKSMKLFESMGINPEKLRLRQHKDDEKAFYSSDTWDIEFISEGYGRIEIVGISDRTNHDLKSHQELSKVSMEVTKEGRRFIPHVIEIAYGVDRPVYCVLESCIREQKGEKERTYFKFPKEAAPYRAAVFPLVKKDGIPEKAQEVFKKLIELGVYVQYDKAGSIGKRYARADEVGVPCSITIDYDTLKDDTVTVRDRDTMEQKRVKISELASIV